MQFNFHFFYYNKIFVTFIKIEYFLLYLFIFFKVRAVFEVWSLGCFKCLLWMKNSGPHSWSIKLWSQGVCSGICNLIKHPDASHVDLKALCLAEVSMYYIQSPRMLFISVNVQPRKSAPAFNFTSHILISWTNFKICFYILRKLATIN